MRQDLSALGGRTHNSQQGLTAPAPDVQKFVDNGVARNDSTGRTGQAKFLDKYTKGFINRTTEDLGKLGADVSESMVRGAKVKSDIGNELRPIKQRISTRVLKRLLVKLMSDKSNLCLRLTKRSRPR